MDEFLKGLEMSDEQILVYKYLLEYGESTVLEVSRSTLIKRTNLYRTIGDLEGRGLVLKSVKDKRSKYRISGLDFLDRELEKKENNIQRLYNLRDNVRSEMEGMAKHSTNELEVIHYTGRDEVRQLVWNSLKAKGVLRSFGFRTTREAVGDKFLREWWNESMIRGIKHLLLADASTFEMKNASGKGSKIKLIENDDLYLTKTFSKGELPIITETFIYNDTYGILQWDEKQIFGVEIKNPIIVKQEILVFDYLWKKADGYLGDFVSKK